MDITGKIILALPPVSGTSKAGTPWKKREYVLETQENYPRKVFFNLFGDRADQYPMNVGDVVKVSFDIESREFNGRWYTDIRAWKVESANATTMPQPGVSEPMPPMGGGMQQQPFPQAGPAPIAPASSEDDLPF